MAAEWRREVGPRDWAMLLSFLVAIVGPICVFGLRKGGGDFIFEFPEAIVWGGPIALVGALLLLWSSWKLPRAATSGAALAAIAATLNGLAIVVGIFRANGEWQNGEPIGLGFLVMALGVTVGSAIHSHRKPSTPRPPRKTLR